MRVKVGDELVCIKKGSWLYLDGRVSELQAPKYLEMVIVGQFIYPDMVYLVGYGNTKFGLFNEANKPNFEKPVDISELTEVLEKKSVEEYVEY